MHVTAGEIATLIGGSLDGPGGTVVSGVSDLSAAGPGDATFIADERYARQWISSKALVALVSKGFDVPDHDATTRTLIRVDNAEIAIISLLTHFAPAPVVPPKGVHPSAVIDDGASIAPSACIGPFVWIGAGCKIDEGVVIHSGARIYHGVSIGAHTVLHANAVVREYCSLGRNVIIHAGAVIGSDGFGYRPNPDGSGLLRIPHLGCVILEDGVEIGSCTCIDRGTFKATRIGAGTKIDNLCQVGHNVQIGRSTVMAALSGIAGSSVVGDWVRIGAGSGIADHRKVGSRAQLAARTALMNDVPDGEVWGGMPARDIRDEMRHILALQKLSPVTRDLLRLVDAAKAQKADKSGKSASEAARS